MSEDWRNEPATEEQKHKLRFFGCTWDDGITAGQASDAIEECAKQFPGAEAAYQKSLPATERQKEKLNFFGCTWNGDITVGEACDALVECTRQFPDKEADWQFQKKKWSKVAGSFPATLQREAPVTTAPAKNPQTQRSFHVLPRRVTTIKSPMLPGNNSVSSKPHDEAFSEGVPISKAESVESEMPDGSVETPQQYLERKGRSQDQNWQRWGLDKAKQASDFLSKKTLTYDAARQMGEKEWHEWIGLHGSYGTEPGHKLTYGDARKLSEREWNNWSVSHGRQVARQSDTVGDQPAAPVFIPPTPEQFAEIRSFGKVPPKGLTFQEATTWIEQLKIFFAPKTGRVPPEPQTVERHDWRTAPASEKQKEKLRLLGCTFDDGITVGIAKLLIECHKAESEISHPSVRREGFFSGDNQPETRKTEAASCQSTKEWDEWFALQERIKKRSIPFDELPAQEVTIREVEVPTPTVATPVFIPPTPEQLDDIRSFGQTPPSGLTFQEAKIWIEQCKLLYPAKPQNICLQENLEHKYTPNGFCKNCGWERSFIEKTQRACLATQESKSTAQEVTIQEAAKPQNTSPREIIPEAPKDFRHHYEMYCPACDGQIQVPQGTIGNKRACPHCQSEIAPVFTRRSPQNNVIPAREVQEYARQKTPEKIEVDARTVKEPKRPKYLPYPREPRHTDSNSSLDFDYANWMKKALEIETENQRRHDVYCAAIKSWYAKHNWKMDWEPQPFPKSPLRQNTSSQEVTIQQAAKPQIRRPTTYNYHGPIERFSEWVDNFLERNQTCLGGHWLPAGPLSYVFGSEAISIGLCRQVADTIESKGYCVEPDARFGSGTYDRNQTLALFKPLDDDPIQPSAAYLGAANLLRLCILIASADGRIDIVELDVFRKAIENQIGLSLTDHKRLLILEQLLAQELCSAAKTIAKIAKSVPADKRLVIGKLLVRVAAANLFITNEERRVLERIFKAF